MKKVLVLLTSIAVVGIILILIRSNPPPEDSADTPAVESTDQSVQTTGLPIPPSVVSALVQMSFNNQITAANVQEYFAAEMLPLAKDQETLLIRGKGLEMCSPTGNCPAYVFLKEGSGYRMILEMDAVQTVKALELSTNGYHDIRASMHGSATTSGVTVFKFNGMEYKARECFSEEYSLVDDNLNGVKIPKDPLITPRDCER